PVLDDAVAAQAETLGDRALTKEQYVSMLEPLFAHRFVVERVERDGLSGVELSGSALNGGLTETTRQVFRRHAVEQDEREAQREKATGQHRPKVIPVAFDMCPPAGLGAVVAYSKVHEDGALEEFYNFRTDWVWDPKRLESFTAEPAIYMFTNYLWSHKECVEVCAQIKALSPDSITIHGGPDTPKYANDQERYFAENPHVDIAVRGEGEVVGAMVLSALRSVIGDKNPDLGVLKDVGGVTYRTATGIQRNPDAPRVKDLDMLPSAYLTGLFDTYMGLDDLFVILETNRGCPYGCTFCDWGSATASKIRKFDIDRVMAEIEWTSRARVASVSIADANFGIFPRDVDIARKAAQQKKDTGFPRGFGGNFAKNTVTHLRTIIDVLAEGNILSLGTLSLQSMDEATLDIINRSNIKTEKYDALAVEMRNADLPLTVELMMGLPGSTTDSFREDLQQCIDRELPARVNMTTMLVNSPMNDPEYVKKHEIKTSMPVGPGALASLISTSSYTHDDLEMMGEMRSAYMLFENFAVLRTLSRFVRQETPLDEMQFYQRLILDGKSYERWPMLHLLCNFVPSLMAPPTSWNLVVEELGRYLKEELGLSDSPALRSVLAAQKACLPAHDRVWPQTLELECDVVSWFNAIIAEKESGNRRGWTDAVPRLETYGPASLTVDDPMGVTETSLGINRELNAFGVNWELESPLHRARADLV
ncbi:MAG: radical SAM protein, partial [Halioglobus sp.]